MFKNCGKCSVFLKNVIKYTFIVEGIGAILLLFVFVPEYGVLKGIYFAVFHAISAFCNAGFDVLGNNSLIGYQTNIIINLVIPGLIIMGGLGFIVWFDVMETIKKEYKKPGVKRREANKEMIKNSRKKKKKRG